MTLFSSVFISRCTSRSSKIIPSRMFNYLNVKLSPRRSAPRRLAIFYQVSNFHTAGCSGLEKRKYLVFPSSYSSFIVFSFTSSRWSIEKNSIRENKTMLARGFVAVEKKKTTLHGSGTLNTILARVHSTFLIKFLFNGTKNRTCMKNRRSDCPTFSWFVRLFSSWIEHS